MYCYGADQGHEAELQQAKINIGGLAAVPVTRSAAENYLTMKVWAPANLPTSNKVASLAWTYGDDSNDSTGGSNTGNRSEGLFNLSTDFASVSYNYRMGTIELDNGLIYTYEGGIANAAVWNVEPTFE